MRKCRSAGRRSRHAVLWRRLALAAAVFCLCWHLADCIEDAMWPAMREVAQHECRSLVVQCLNTAVYGELSANPQRYAGLYTLNGGCLLGDSERINTARAALVQTAQQALNTMPKNDISISLGSLSGSIFLLEMGPGWTVHLNPDGYVEGRMEETMEPAAINRTRFTADLVLETTVNVILNGRAALTQVKAAQLAARAVSAQCYSAGTPFADQSTHDGFAEGIAGQIETLGALPGAVTLLQISEDGYTVEQLLYAEGDMRALYDAETGYTVWRAEQRIRFDRSEVA